MSLSKELKELVERMEKQAGDVLDLVEDPKLANEFIKIVAETSVKFEKLADRVDSVDKISKLTEEDIDVLYAMAEEFDQSDDPILKKQASVLDEILLTLAAPKNALAEAAQKSEDEINKIIEKKRQERGDQAYNSAKEALDKANMVEEQRKAVNDQVKRYRPMEAPLQTRYNPDIPGESLMRLSDHVYQSPLTGKIYDYRAGYTTDKGNKIPGTAVEFQTPDLGSGQSGRAMFDTRENVMSRYASNIDVVLNAIKK